MNTNQENQRILSVGEIFAEKTSYKIPLYQRNYAWGEPEISQLFADITAGLEEQPNQPYYLGTLVVARSQIKKGSDKEDHDYELIDGQQRFTTLLIILINLRNRKALGETQINAELSFECREKSTNTLEALLANENPELDFVLNSESKKENLAILRGYKEVKKQLASYCKNYDEAEQKLASYILNNLKILRVVVPENTDVNHYFEVMNNRGEQLEKHEVLKANLMGQLEDSAKEAFAKIWDACSDMSRYVQAGFDTPLRSILFGDDWQFLVAPSFEKIQEKIEETINAKEDKKEEISLAGILKSSANAEHAISGEQHERFQAMIDFPNFLLHALRSYLKPRSQIETKVSLNDKTLLESFKALKNSEDIKNFAYHLLRCRYLFDRYIIKHETVADKESWVLKRYGKRQGQNDKRQEQGDYWVTFGKDQEDEEDINRQDIYMLQTALHVSYPTKTYKYWLAGALDFLISSSTPKSSCDKAQEPIDLNSYFDCLNRLAKNFISQRYLADTALEFDAILSGLDKESAPFELLVSNSTLKPEVVDRLKYNNHPHSLIFNYLDFLIWQQRTEEKKYGLKEEDFKQFKFTQRSAIEHFYPQQPKNGKKPWEDETLHAFGNLCLISASNNSTFSNDSPEEKAKSYQESSNLSLKNKIMFEHARKQNSDWTPKVMLEHQKEMLELLVTALKD